MQRLGTRLALSMMLVSMLSVVAVVAGLYLFSRRETQRLPNEFGGVLAQWRDTRPTLSGQPGLRPPPTTFIATPSTRFLVSDDDLRAAQLFLEELSVSAAALEPAGQTVLVPGNDASFNVTERGVFVGGPTRLRTDGIEAARVALLDWQDMRVALVQAQEMAQTATAQVGLVAQGFDRVQSAQWRGIGFGLAVAAVLSTLLAWWLARSVARPVEAVGLAATALAQGQLSRRVKMPASPLNATSEVSRLAGDFNRMAESLERYEGERQAMIADIAHELRTPLTAMTLRLEALSDGLVPLSAGEVERLRHQAGLLHRLVEDLRTLSLADAGRLELRRGPQDILALARDALTDASMAAAAKGVRLELIGDDASEPLVEGDGDRLAQVLGNLLDNAIRVTPSGGRVVAEVGREGSEAVWRVRDDGPGIPSSDLPEIFQRFRQGADGRRDLRGGSGLGLTIVRTLVELHGGTVSAANLPAADGGTSGAELTVRLPSIA